MSSIKKWLRSEIARVVLRKDGIRIARGTYISSGVAIGAGTRINAASYLGPCRIGRYCAIAGRLIVRSSNHFTNYLNMQDELQKKVIESKVAVAGRTKGEVIIGDGVWIGDSVIVLPGVNIGNGAVVGAGSVVTKGVAPFTIVAGNPARPIRRRFSDEVIEVVQDELRWWEWPADTMRLNKWVFELDLSQVDADDLRAFLRNNLRL